VITYTYADATTGCEANDQATIVVWACLGIDGDEQITILMYPNPSTGVFNVSGLDLGTKYKVLSESGQVVAEGKTNALEATIDLSKMSSGKYFLTTQVNGENITMELLLAK
jgi:hypothetical protein